MRIPIFGGSSRRRGFDGLYMEQALVIAPALLHFACIPRKDICCHCSFRPSIWPVTTCKCIRRNTVEAAPHPSIGALYSVALSLTASSCASYAPFYTSWSAVEVLPCD